MPRWLALGHFLWYNKLKYGGNEKMAEEFVTLQVHQEFAKRIDEENTRQNHRLSDLEKNFAMIQTLAISTEKLALNMEIMAKEVAKQGSRLEVLELKPVKRWELVITTIITGIVGAIVGFAMSLIF